MKILSYLLFMCCLCNQVASQQQSKTPVYLFSYFKNNGQDGLHLAYSKDGYTWKSLHKDSSILQPAVAKDKLMRDPCIIRGADGKFHMVWTVSWKDRGIGYANSTDLVHWSAQEFIPVMQHEPKAQNCWAPEIIYDNRSRSYMIFWATTIPGRFPLSDSSGDNNHRIYFVTTKDFKHFTEAKLLYEQGFNVIDATIAKDGKRYVMFLKDETRKPVQKNIRVAFSTQLTKGYGKPSAAITGVYWAEGPTAIKIGDKWMVYFDKYTQHTYGAVMSQDLVHWSDVSDKISFPKGTRHGTVFTVTTKEFEALKKLLGD